jgi:hypothetical protein
LNDRKPFPCSDAGSILFAAAAAEATVVGFPVTGRDEILATSKEKPQQRLGRAARGWQAEACPTIYSFIRSSLR